jgi:hypothetical protein
MTAPWSLALWTNTSGETITARGDLPMPAMFMALGTAGVGLLVCRDRGLAVCDDYEPPFTFTGILHRVVIESHAAAGAPDPGSRLEVTLRGD